MCLFYGYNFIIYCNKLIGIFIMDEIKLVGLKRAKVTNNVSADGSIALFIPETMMEMGGGDPADPEITETSIKGSFAKNSPYKPNIKAQSGNSIWARPTFFSNDEQEGSKMCGKFKVPKIGSWVYMFFENGDSQKPYWLPISPTISGKGIDATMMVGHDAAGAKMANMSIIDSFGNGTIIFYDENPDANAFVIRLGSGHLIQSRSGGGVSQIEFLSKDGHNIKIDDTNKLITLKSVGGQEVTINDAENKVTVKANDTVMASNNHGSSCELGPSGTKIKGTRIDMN